MRGIYFYKQQVVLIGISVALLFLVQPVTSFGATSGLTLTTTIDNNYASSEFSEDRCLEVLVKASEKRQGFRYERPPLNIAVVLDRSGSMAEEQKLRSAIKAVWAVVQKLGPEDHFSLVTYNGGVEIPIAANSGHSKARIRHLLDRIKARGSTNLSGGLLEGYQQVERYYSPQRINRVMLFSDGQITEGIRSSSRLNDIVMDYSQEGISLTTFGMGHDFNENLMASLSESGRGMYYFIDHSSRVADMLAKEFRTVETLVAQDIRLDVQIGKGFDIAEVFANKYDIIGQKIIMYGGDLAAGELRRFQVRLTTKPGRPGKIKVGRVKMSYTPMGEDRRVTEKQRLSMHFKKKGNLARYRNKDVSERSAIFKAHYARARAADAVDEGNFEKAEKIIAKAKQELQETGIKSKKLEEQSREVEAYGASLNKKMDRKARLRLQKAVKYDRYVIEGC